MRSRNLKPGFFKNEQLAELPFEARLMFAGLWCMADRAGRLEDRPKRIKIELFPGDSFDIDAVLNLLQESGLIVRYQVGNVRCIQVLNFLKHQHPHQKEPPSALPEVGDIPVQAPDEPGASPVQAPDLSGAGTGAARLIPSSLIPDSGSLIPDPPLPAVSGASQTLERMKRLKLVYPPCRAPRWINAQRAIEYLIDNRIATWDELEAAVIRYAAYCKATGREVREPSAWFGDRDGKPWTDPWPVPPPQTRGKPAAPDDTAAWEKARERAAAIGFRDPYPQESVGGYSTQLRHAEEEHKRGRPRAVARAVGELVKTMRVGS